MHDLVLRTMSLGLRFACPLLILAFSTQENLGHYYLFSSFFTMTAVFIAMEIGTPFSEKYSKCTSKNGRKIIFNSFIQTQIFIASILAMPFSLIYFALYQVDNQLIFLLAILFTSEACVNEVGRFYWNIGLAKEASLRDFYRAASFITALLLAILLKDEVVNTISLILLTTFNIFISVRDHQRLGARPFRLQPYSIRVRRLRTILGKSGMQFFHVQILLSQPFLERLLLEKKLGLGTMGIFAFQTTLVQASSTLFLMPLISKTRSVIFSTRSRQDRAPYLSALHLALKATLTCSGLAVFIHFSTPYAAFISQKLTGIDSYTLAISTLIAISSSYSTAVAPLFCRHQRHRIANLQSLLAVMVLLLPFATTQVLKVEYIWLSLAISYGLQLIFRVTRFTHDIIECKAR